MDASERVSDEQVRRVLSRAEHWAEWMARLMDRKRAEGRLTPLTELNHRALTILVAYARQKLAEEKS